MDKYSQLIRDMAEAFMKAVHVLETENSRLKSENELLALRLREYEARTDEWIERSSK